METKRLNLNLDEVTARSLKDIKYTTDLTFTAILKRAVKLLDFLLDAEAKGLTLQLADKHGKVIKTVSAFNLPKPVDEF